MATNGAEQWDDLEAARAPACDVANSERAATLSWSNLLV